MANYTRFMMQGLFEYLIINTNDVIVSQKALFNCYSQLIACLLRIQKPFLYMYLKSQLMVLSTQW